ncbi:sigma factor-like helix-turn-helix DNA-binding protein [Patescibacteria group bacterium]
MNIQKTPVRTFQNAQKIVQDLLILLSQKEKHVIKRRFNLDNTYRATLEEIGKEFNVTRERIRQIEKNALTKLQRNVGNTDLNALNEFIKEILKEKGGVMTEENLFAALFNILNKNDVEINKNAINLSLTLDKELQRTPNTINYQPYIKYADIDHSHIKNITEKTIDILSKKSDVHTHSKIFDELRKHFKELDHSNLPQVISVFTLDKRLKPVEGGIGLASWRHINPKTLRDKIYYVLNKNKKPLHFVEIVNKITELRFDNKRINLQAVHNELIRHDQFVLVGRGIYALKEWGYKEGTVADIIQGILKDGKAMSQENIIKEVMKQRQVKKITIILNLKNKPQFERIGREQYKLKKK